MAIKRSGGNFSRSISNQGGVSRSRTPSNDNLFLNDFKSFVGNYWEYWTFEALKELSSKTRTRMTINPQINEIEGFAKTKFTANMIATFGPKLQVLFPQYRISSNTINGVMQNLDVFENDFKKKAKTNVALVDKKIEEMLKGKKGKVEWTPTISSAPFDFIGKFKDITFTLEVKGSGQGKGISEIKYYDGVTDINLWGKGTDLWGQSPLGGFYAYSTFFSRGLIPKIPEQAYGNFLYDSAFFMFLNNWGTVVPTPHPSSPLDSVQIILSKKNNQLKIEATSLAHQFISYSGGTGKNVTERTTVHENIVINLDALYNEIIRSNNKRNLYWELKKGTAGKYFSYGDVMNIAIKGEADKINPKALTFEISLKVAYLNALHATGRGI